MTDFCGAHAPAHPVQRSADQCRSVNCQWWLLPIVNYLPLKYAPETEVFRRYLVLNSLLSSLPVSQHWDQDNEKCGFIHRSFLGLYSLARVGVGVGGAGAQD